MMQEYDAPGLERILARAEESGALEVRAAAVCMRARHGSQLSEVRWGAESLGAGGGGTHAGAGVTTAACAGERVEHPREAVAQQWRAFPRAAVPTRGVCRSMNVQAAHDMHGARQYRVSA